LIDSETKQTITILCLQLYLNLLDKGRMIEASLKDIQEDILYFSNISLLLFVSSGANLLIRDLNPRQELIGANETITRKSRTWDYRDLQPYNVMDCY